MRRMGFVIVAMVAAIVVACLPAFGQPDDGPWPMFRHDMQRTGRCTYVGPEKPILKWSYRTGGDVYSSPAIGSDGSIYVGSDDENLYAINPDGSCKWTFFADQRVESSPAIGADGTIYVGGCEYNGGTFYAINHDGSLKWYYDLGQSVDSSPAIGADGTIYVTSWEGKLYAFNPNGSLKWSAQAEYMIPASPAVDLDGTIYVPDDASYMYAVNPDGSLKWRYLTDPGDFRGSVAVGADGTIYVGSILNAEKLYAFNPNGTLKWDILIDSWLWSSPAIGADGTIYIGSGDNHLYAFNPNGSLKWSYRTRGKVYSSPAIDDEGTIYVGSYDSTLYAINPDGSRKWKFKTGDVVHSSPAIGADGTIYVGSHDDKLYAIGIEQSIEYIGPPFLSGIMRKNVIDEDDCKITCGDHIHVRLPFLNLSSNTIHDVKVSFCQESHDDHTPDLNFSITGTSGYTDNLAVNLGDMHPLEIDTADFWIYVDTLSWKKRTTPEGNDPSIYISFPGGQKSVPINLKLIDFGPPPDEWEEMTHEDCLHHPNDFGIRRFAQYAMGNPSEGVPTIDPDKISLAVQYCHVMVDKFIVDGNNFFDSWRKKDTQLLYDPIGVCTRHSDFLAGLLRTAGLPARFVAASLGGSLLGEGHAWNEVYIKEPPEDPMGWTHVDAFWGAFNYKMIYVDRGKPPNVVWGDKVPLSTKECIIWFYQCISSCYEQPPSKKACTDCGNGKYPTGKGCLEDLTDQYNPDLILTNANGDNLLLALEGPVAVTLDSPFTLEALLINNSSHDQDSIWCEVSLRLFVDDSTDTYYTDDPIRLVEHLAPGDSALLEWEMTPLAPGSGIPIAVVAINPSSYVTAGLLQTVNVEGTLPDLKLSTWSDDSVSVGEIVEFGAFVLNDTLLPIEDADVSAIVFSKEYPGFQDSLVLIYNAVDEIYEASLEITLDAPYGTYEAAVVAEKEGYEADSASTYFFVVPDLTVTAIEKIAPQSQYSLDDVVMLLAKVHRADTVITSANVEADIIVGLDQDTLATVPMPYSEDNGHYFIQFKPGELLPVTSNTFSIPLGDWTVRMNASYYGAQASDEMTIKVVPSTK